MRGPELVGNPPNNLRWSGDSKELYFEWLIPKDDQPSTWVVGRDGGAPRRLSEAERRMAPLANGQWDAKRRRILGVDRGDIVIIDTVARKRIDVTRTTGNESSPRWARGETHVTFVRDNNLFIVPVESVVGGSVVQLTDVSARRTDPRLDRQPEVHQGRRSRSCSTGSSRRRRAASAARSAIAPARCRSSSWPSARTSPMPRCPATASSRSSSSTIARRRGRRRCRDSSASRRSPKRSRRARLSATRRIAAASRC